MTGRLRPGEHLPLDRLAQQWDVSVTPVREALLALRGAGLVDLEPRRGFTVAALTRQDIEDVYLTLATIAGELAARAARRITAQTLAELEDIQTALEQAEPQGSDGMDSSFHQMVNDAAESAKLVWLFETLWHYTPRQAAVTVSGWRNACVIDHRAVQRALRDRDPRSARHCMHAHLTNTGRLLVRHLEQRRFWSG